ncbi:hypothetical protein TNCV_2887351 [Trichonephila clavipes]|nr:hypothetical protein TNCV_2887351 [Trichonephila clavipes]
MVPASNKKRCAVFPFETGIYFRRKTDFIPEEDTTKSYSGFEPTGLQAEGSWRTIDDGPHLILNYVQVIRQDMRWHLLQTSTPHQQKDLVSTDLTCSNFITRAILRLFEALCVSPEKSFLRPWTPMQK